ncbi:MAG: hypothetical protein ACFFDN_41815, partial [Candidatus Hodarchaeota archaeon]
DNPLFHGAMYVDLKTNIKYGCSTFRTDIIAEHRGESYGNFDINNMIIFPKIYIAVDTSFQYKNETFNVGISTGNYDNLDHYDRLILYNIDVQRVLLYVRRKGLELSYLHVADLCRGIGLNIDDLIVYKVTWRDLSLGEQFKTTLAFGIFNLKKPTDRKYSFENYAAMISGNIKHNNGFQLYNQIAIRNQIKDSSGYLKRIAYVLGCHFKIDRKKSNISGCIEYRYYGKYFNWGFLNNNHSFYYRDRSLFTYSNTIGKAYYPLQNYLRPFSQWAVYTEYQRRNVRTLIFRFKSTIQISHDFFLNIEPDFNLLEASGEKLFLYSFFDANIEWRPTEVISLYAGITNKGMNLDKHYQTFYLYKIPVVMLSISYSVQIPSHANYLNN